MYNVRSLRQEVWVKSAFLFCAWLKALHPLGYAFNHLLFTILLSHAATDYCYFRQAVNFSLIYQFVYIFM